MIELPDITQLQTPFLPYSPRDHGMELLTPPYLLGIIGERIHASRHPLPFAIIEVHKYSKEIAVVKGAYRAQFGYVACLRLRDADSAVMIKVPVISPVLYGVKMERHPSFCEGNMIEVHLLVKAI